MKKLIFTSMMLLVVTNFSFSLYAGKADKIKDEFNGSVNGWGFPADHKQGVMEITPDNFLRITRTGEGDWFMMQKTVTVDFNLYPELAVRLTKMPEQGRWFFKIEQGDFWKELLPDNSYMAEIEGADDEYLESIYVWNIRDFLREEGIPTTEPVTLNLQMTLQQTEPGNSMEFDWIRSDYNDNKVDPADDNTRVQVTGGLTDNMDNADGWSVLAGGNIIAENGMVGIQTAGPDPWSILIKDFSEDLSKFPYLSAKIVDANRKWALKFQGDGIEKVLDQSNANESGSMYTWNLSEITGLEGKQNFKIQIVAENGLDAYVKLDWIKSLDFILREIAEAKDGTVNDDMSSATGWKNIDAGEIFAENGMVGVRAQNGSTQGWYVIRKDYTENVDENPYLSVKIGDYNEDWTIKVVGPTGEKELVKALAYNSGKEYIWNLQRITGTNGSNSYGVQLLALGTNGATYFSVDEIKTLKYIDKGGSGIVSSELKNIQAYGAEGKIVIQSETPDAIRISDMLGRTIHVGQVEAGICDIPVSEKGVYIVSTLSGAVKVVVK